jgi:hypothetical protein
MKCREVKKALVAYQDGEVMPSERTLMEAHLAGCRSCEQELAALNSSRGKVTDSLKSMAGEATPSPQAWNHLQARIEAKTVEKNARGGRTMKLRWRIAFGTAGAVVLAAAVIAAVPTSRAAAGDFLAEVFHIQQGPTAQLTYVPVAFAAGPVVVTGSASIGPQGQDAKSQEQTVYQNGSQFLLVKTGNDTGEPLPKGQAADVNGQAAVLATGLSGSLAEQLALTAPEGAQAVTASGSAQLAPASGGGQLVPIGSGGVNVSPASGENPATIVVGGDGSVVSESGVSVSGDAPAGPATVIQGTPPDLPTMTYKDASSLTWVVNGTRVEVLSNLPLAELQKIADGLVLAK